MIDGAETYPINVSANIIDCDYDKSVIVHHFGTEAPIEQSQLNSHLISCSWTNNDMSTTIIWLPQTQSLQKKPRQLALFLLLTPTPLTPTT